MTNEETLMQDIINGLKMIYDPEIPVDVYNLGLIYNIELTPNDQDQFDAKIQMTLTSVGCPVGSMLVQNVYDRVNSTKGVSSVKTDLVFDPPWTPANLSEEAREELSAMGIIPESC